MCSVLFNFYMPCRVLFYVSHKYVQLGTPKKLQVRAKLFVPFLVTR